MKTLFKKYYRRVAWQGFLKALLFSATVGLAVNFVAAFILWFTDAGLLTVLLIAILAFCVVTAVLLPVSYFKFFRPTTSQIARLIDRLGLEERMITMYEMQRDESYMAMLQREDAQRRLKNVARRDVKMQFPRLALVVLAVAFVFGTSMTTVSALAATGNVSRGGDIFDPSKDDPPEEDDEKEYVTIDYLAGEGGIIAGETHQRIEKGTDAEPVTATPRDGYVFVVWSDGILTAQRWDWSVSEDMVVEAQFEPAPEQDKDGDNGEDGDNGGEDGDNESEDGDGNEGNGGKEDGEKNEGESNGEKGDGEDGDGPGEGDGPEGEGGPDYGNGQDTDGSGGNNSGNNDGAGPDKGPGQGNNAGPGASPGADTDNNNIIDGKTDYHDVIDPEKNKEDLADDDSIPPELKDILDGYFDSLTP